MEILSSSAPHAYDRILLLRAEPSRPGKKPAGAEKRYRRLTGMMDTLLTRAGGRLPTSAIVRYAVAEKFRLKVDYVGDVIRVRYDAAHLKKLVGGGNALLIVFTPGFQARAVGSGDDPSRFDERIQFVVTLLKASGEMIRQDRMSASLKAYRSGKYEYRNEGALREDLERYLIRNILERRVHPILMNKGKKQ